MGRKPTFRKAEKARYVRLVALHGNRTLACNACGIAYSTFLRHYGQDLEFAKAVDQALEEAGDLLEAEAFRRGYEGYEEPIYQNGQLVGSTKKYSDRLLTMLLTAAKPDKYSNKTVHTHKGSIEHRVEADATEKLLEKLNKAIDVSPKKREPQLIQAQVDKDVEDAEELK